MGAINLQLPDSLHRQAKQLAQREGISVNQLIHTAVAEKLSELMNLEYLQERARRGDRDAFMAIMGHGHRPKPEPGEALE